MGSKNQISKSDNLSEDTPITGDESDKSLNNPPQTNSGSTSEDERENFLNNPPQNGLGSTSKDEPDRLLSIHEPPPNRDRVVNVNVPPSVTKIQLCFNLKEKDPSPDAQDGPDNPSNYKIEINLFKKPPSTDLSSSEDDEPKCEEVHSTDDQPECEEVQSTGDQPECEEVQSTDDQQECQEVESTDDQQECEEVKPIDDRLLEAAMSGKFSEVLDPDILLGTTPQRSTCLHISSIFGYQKFFEEVVTLNRSLLSKVNSDDETPLIVAVKYGHVVLASAMLEQYQHPELKEKILKPDNNKDNVLHHAIRNGHSGLALKLIAKEPDLSQGVNKYNESPLYIAVLRDLSDVSESLLKIPHCSYSGPFEENALHAAVRLGDAGQYLSILNLHSDVIIFVRT